MHLTRHDVFGQTSPPPDTEMTTVGMWRPSGKSCIHSYIGSGASKAMNGIEDEQKIYLLQAFSVRARLTIRPILI